MPQIYICNIQKNMVSRLYMKDNSSESLRLTFDDFAHANTLFGAHNSHLNLLAQASGVKLETIGTTLIIQTQDKDLRLLLSNVFMQLYSLIQKGKTVTHQEVLRVYNILKNKPEMNITNLYGNTIFLEDANKLICAKNLAQQQYFEALQKYELVFAVGPAGTGKTYLAVAIALSMLRRKSVKKIILTRPAVEAGERLGFLPGDLSEKINPYLRPLFDALHDMLSQAKVIAMLEDETIEIAPLAFMRGRTLNNSFIILDEAQNTTQEQMKMLLTRLGLGSRLIVTGDITQIDLPPTLGNNPKARSGLIHALKILSGIKNIGFVHFTEADVMRHPLVGEIIKAYEQK